MIRDARLVVVRRSPRDGHVYIFSTMASEMKAMGNLVADRVYGRETNFDLRDAQNVAAKFRAMYVMSGLELTRKDREIWAGNILNGFIGARRTQQPTSR